MIENIKKYANMRGVSLQDALQVFMQVVILKNLNIEGTKLIGGTSLVIGHSNPRFSEDIDLAEVKNPLLLRSGITKGAKMLGGFLGGLVKATPPKKGKNTWRISCKLEENVGARLHVDSQPYPPLTHHPLMVEYPGISPFVFPSIELSEIMADKIIALAFRNNLSGRDLFDLWYHWFKIDGAGERWKTIKGHVLKKLSARSLDKDDLAERIRDRIKGNVSKRVREEWDRYLPHTLKNEGLYDDIFATVGRELSKVDL